MKNLLPFVLGALILLPLSVQACPNLAGEYYCVTDDGRREPTLDIFKIEQSVSTETPGVTNFTTGYRSIPGGDDSYSADAVGIPDGWGWIIKCTADRLVSVRDDFSALSELYLDKTDKLVFTYNYKVTQICSRKK